MISKEDFLVDNCESAGTSIFGKNTYIVKYWHLNIDTLDTLTFYWVFLKSMKFGRALNISGDLQNSISIK